MTPTLPTSTYRVRPQCRCVIFLTVFTTVVLTSLALSSCSYLKSRSLDSCKTHAFVETQIEDYLTRRFNTGAPVRMGIIPYTVPANLSGIVNQYPGLGNELARLTHAQFLNREIIPITEVVNRDDWPRKKDEFFKGNFGALSQAREAGYDLIFVGLVENLAFNKKLILSTKMIEVESGITLWYGRTIVTTDRRDYDRTADYLNFEDRDPSASHQDLLVETAASCTVKEVLADHRGM